MLFSPGLTIPRKGVSFSVLVLRNARNAVCIGGRVRWLFENSTGIQVNGLTYITHPVYQNVSKSDLEICMDRRWLISEGFIDFWTEWVSAPCSSSCSYPMCSWLHLALTHNILANKWVCFMITLLRQDPSETRGQQKAMKEIMLIMVAHDRTRANWFIAPLTVAITKTSWSWFVYERVFQHRGRGVGRGGGLYLYTLLSWCMDLCYLFLIISKLTEFKAHWYCCYECCHPAGWRCRRRWRDRRNSPRLCASR